MSFDARGRGAALQDWQAAGYRASLPALDLGPMQRLVVVAAHPDDETLMAGGLIAVAAYRGLPVVVVVASSGEASHPTSPTWTRAALAAEREREVVAAIALLAPQADVRLLRLPDGALSGERDALARALTGAVRAGDAVVSPWLGDGHPDHTAVAEAAARAADDAGAVHLQAPVWAWHWSDPAAPGWPDAVRLDLPAAAADRKRRAVELHLTQVRALSDRDGDEVLLLPGVLEHFRTDDEVFFPSSPARPVDFGAMYEASDDPWGFEDRWYERRKRALLNAALPQERYDRLLEIGCSTGIGTAELAERCGSVVAVDVADSAVAQARARLRDLPNVQVQQRLLPQEWPQQWGPGSFDAIVLSEVGFYLAGDALGEVVDRCRTALTPGGVLVACHWRPQVLGLDRGGEAVHRTVQQRLGAERVVLHREDDFVLEVFQMPPATSVARATGLR